MEVARLVPFYDTARLYSWNNVFNEKVFKYEIWQCHEYMKLPLEDIYNLPVSDRKDFISIHNNLNKKQ